MVLEIRISNFFSIKDEIIIDFRAANINSTQSKMLTDNVFSVKDEKLLKTICIYGANASGKSNIIKAIRFCNSLITESHNFNENITFNYKKFKFLNYLSKPSTYLIRFLLNEIEYEYSFSLSQETILAESLYYYPKGRRKEVFKRDEKANTHKKGKYHFTDVIKRPMDVAENTSNKTLFISRASQMDREMAKDIFNYFHKTFILNYYNFSISGIEKISNENIKQLEDALKIADFDIEKVVIHKLKKPVQSILADLENMTLRHGEEKLEDFLEIKSYHKNNPKIAFDFLKEESEGTKIFFLIMLTILNILKENKILLIDEIETSLHPKIVDYILKLFKNGNQAQLLCTTHNSKFLDLKKFRKDQIFFCNKKEDGSTDLYSLYDYTDFRETMDLEKAYLQGRFDAIPYINDSDMELINFIK